MTETVPQEANGSSAMQGSKVDPVYTRRKMKMFLLNDGEVRTISILNMQATVFFTIASFFASAGLGIYTNAIFYEKLSPAGQVAWNIAAPSLLVLSVAFLVLGV